MRHVARVKLSVFRDRYFTDLESRPSLHTLVKHIKSGVLSGEQIGSLWYVRCTAWGQPLFYGSATSMQIEHKLLTGNTIADKILASL